MSEKEREIDIALKNAVRAMLAEGWTPKPGKASRARGCRGERRVEMGKRDLSWKAKGFFEREVKDWSEAEEGEKDASYERILNQCEERKAMLPLFAIVAEGELRRRLLEDSRFWGEIGKIGPKKSVDGVGADDRFGGLEDPRDGGAEDGLSLDLDKAERLGRIREMGRGGGGAGWVCALLARMNLGRAEKALSEGVSLKSLSSQESGVLLYEIARWVSPEMEEANRRWVEGGARKKDRREAQERSKEMKRRAWRMAREAGAPKPSCDSMSRVAMANLQPAEEGFVETFREEVRIGGGLDASWGLVIGRMATLWEGGASLIGEAFFKGEKIEMSGESLGWLISQCGKGDHVDEMLDAMAKAGFRQRGAPEDGAAAGRAIMKGGERSFAALGRMGVNLEKARIKGKSLLKALLGTVWKRERLEALLEAAEGAGAGAAKRMLEERGLLKAVMEQAKEEGRGGRIEAFLEVAEKASKGAAKRILAERDEQGGGAMRWAAENLSLEGVEALRRLGLGFREEDWAGNDSISGEGRGKGKKGSSAAAEEFKAQMEMLWLDEGVEKKTRKTNERRRGGV